MKLGHALILQLVSFKNLVSNHLSFDVHSGYSFRAASISLRHVTNEECVWKTCIIFFIDWIYRFPFSGKNEKS